MMGARLLRCAVIGAWCVSSVMLVAQVPSTFTTPQETVKRYTGAVGDFDFQGADLRAVLRSFAEVSGLNIVIDSAVDGTVDIKLMRVPWDQALDVILKSNKLSYIVEGNVVRIVPLTVLDAENLARQKLADSQAPTSIETRAYTLNYARAEELEPLLKVAVLSKFGNVQHDKRTNTLIVRDLPDRLVATADLIATLDKAEPQVEIEARIVQTNRDSARALGVQWGGGGRLDPQIGNTTGLNFPNSGSVVAGTDLSAASPSTTVGLAMRSITGALNLDVALSALERTGNGRVISSPKVTTQNNKQAEMTQGVQIPIQKDQNNTVTIEFKDAALKLMVTPRITAADTVIMDVELENATPDFSKAVNGIPPIDTQRAKTSVQVTDGATTVIGGINVSREQSSQDRTPVLHRIPLLGWLFKNDTSQDENRELLIFITPRIVRSPS
ncbi:MAG TPA: type IV pilus secretin PilQ [Vicinamibacterales bacterium]|nr:type IV pilus secretin PilQ [Acidobacteriota bacterium]HQX82322.1 type IV pilus secretin PilQ [Vicinamibacterales bacterium]